MGELRIDDRSYEIDDVQLVNLQTALAQSLPLSPQVRVVIHDRQGEQHLVVDAVRPFAIHTRSEVWPSLDAVAWLLDELDLLGRIAVVGGES